MAKSKLYEYKIEKADDGWKIIGFGADGAPEEVHVGPATEDASKVLIGHLILMATTKFPGTFQGVLTEATAVSTKNGYANVDGVVAKNMPLILTTTLAIEEIVAKRGLKWGTTIPRAEVNQMAARIIVEADTPMSPKSIAKAAVAFGLAPTTALPDDVAPFVKQAVDSGKFDIRSGGLLQKFYEIAKNVADEKYGAATLFEGKENQLTIGFMRDLTWMERLVPGLTKQAATRAVDLAARQAGLEPRQADLTLEETSDFVPA